MKTNVKASLLVIAVFFFGIVAGGIATYFWVPRGVESSDGSPDGERRRPRFDFGEFSRELGLDQQQETTIKQILEESKERFHASSRESKEIQKQIREETRQKVKAVLRPDQQAKHDRFLEEWKKRRRRNQDNP